MLFLDDCHVDFAVLVLPPPCDDDDLDELAQMDGKTVSVLGNRDVLMRDDEPALVATEEATVDTSSSRFFSHFVWSPRNGLSRCVEIMYSITATMITMQSITKEAIKMNHKGPLIVFNASFDDDDDDDDTVDRNHHQASVFRSQCVSISLRLFAQTSCKVLSYLEY